MRDEGVSKDYVYILSNPTLKGELNQLLYKVGETHDILQRVESLSATSSIPAKFRVEKSVFVYDGRAHEVEQDIHRRLSVYRYNPNREFFTCDLETIIEVLQILVDSRVCEWYTVPGPIIREYTNRTSEELAHFKVLGWKCYEIGVNNQTTTKKRSNVKTYFRKGHVTKVLEALSENKGEFYRIAETDISDITQDDKDTFKTIIDNALTFVKKELPVTQTAHPKAILNLFREVIASP
tara:strand:- start:427 stop:1137 length:711 start_codon:yes stop_codon:yes gene_type:complete